MERVVRLYQLWTWLPHFRAVAETEHLPTASAALGLSPSALSRALKQLEASVGCDLFVREKRSIRLNAQGKEVLQAVRLAMRGIDDALTALEQDDMPIVLRVAAPGPFHGALLLDIVERLREEHPRLRIELASCAEADIMPKLCRGEIDLSIHESAVRHEDLESVELATIPKVLACAPSHPLASSDAIDAKSIAPYGFAAPPENERGIREDGWPHALARDVTLTVFHMQTGIDACLRGSYLVVLPRPIAVANGLVALNLLDVALPTKPLFATSRTPSESQPSEIGSFLRELQLAFAD